MKPASLIRTLIACALLAPALAWSAAAADDKEATAKALAAFRKDEPYAYDAVVARGEAAVDGVVAIMRDKGLPVHYRFVAANALGEIGSKRAVKPLIEALGDREFNVRRCAALALGRIGDRSAEQPLRRLAANDPFAWRDPDTGEVRHLVRDDAKAALEALFAGSTTRPATRPAGRGQLMKREPEQFMEDASKPPPSPVKVRVKRLDWPFLGDFGAQNLFNNYQQPTDMYVHAGLDLIQRQGTEVRAVDDGHVAAIATNYPNWKTHHYFVVTTEKDGREGWVYTHVDPDSYTFKVGDPVKRGQVLGKVVDFYVGKNKGADHLHLQYGRFTRSAGGRVEVVSLVDPLLFFDWQDTAAPAIDPALRFVAEGTLDEFTEGEDGTPTVRGEVDIIAGISDTAHERHGCNWMVPLVTVEITGEKTKPWRKLVLDQRGSIETATAASALYVGFDAKQRWLKDRPRFPVFHFLKLTNTDGDGVIEHADAAQTWDTRTVPDGVYQVTVRAWDLKGNAASQTGKARIANGVK